MKYILSQPSIKYYTWQLDVAIRSLLNNKVMPNDIHVVSSLDNGLKDEGFNTLEKMFSGVEFYYYHDNRTDKSYPPSARLHLLKKHWRKYPELEKEQIFLMDCDACLIQPLKVNNYKKDKWYLSDAKSYISYDYLVSKDIRFVETFSKIVGIDVELIKDNEAVSGGVQYVMNGLTEAFWEKVENDSNKIYKAGVELNEQILNADSDFHSLQIWCADIWSILYNAWFFEHETIICEDLDFAWPTCPKESIKTKRIFHNAGVMPEHEDLFQKSDYVLKTPYKEKLNINPELAGSWYWAKIQETAKQSILE